MTLKETAVKDEDLRYIAEHLRQSDLAEIEALGYADPMSALLTAVKCEGRAHVLRDGKGRPVCIYGLHRTGNGFNAPWMLGTVLINSNKKDFWVHSQRVVREFDLEGVPMLNIVHRENDAAIAWLSRLGFSVLYDEPVEDPDTGGVFFPFERVPSVRTH